MALIKFKSEAAGVQKEGTFEATLKNVREYTTKSGKDGYWFDFATNEHFDISSLFLDNPISVGLFYNMLNAFGFEDVDGEVDTSDLIGLPVQITIKEKDGRFNIVSYLPSELDEYEDDEDDDDDEYEDDEDDEDDEDEYEYDDEVKPKKKVIKKKKAKK